MGLLNFFSKPNHTSLMRLPSGSFTMDSTGRIVVSTLPSSFPEGTLHDMGRSVLDTFAEARKAGLPLEKLVLQFGSLKVSARDLAGGTIVFFSPVTPISINSKN